MKTRFFDWLDHRVGVRKMMAFMFLEAVPGGAKWRYVWGSTLAFVFSIQLITGILLMTAYSPSSSQAWNSVHFIQYKMDFGWLIRGLHHFGSQTMVVLIALHMLQVVIAGAHLPPREVNWWLGIGLLSVTLGLSLTGYLLPWDQKGYWATRVATNIASNIPIFGDDIKQLAVGGPDYGNHTLTRFFALHVAILPLSLIVLLVCHITIFRRHGVTSKANVEGLVTKPENEESPGSEEFWPRQAFYDMLACMAVFAVMISLVMYGFAHEVTPPKKDGDPEPGLYDKVARAGIYGKGAELDAAADRDTSNYPARPEWYFLFLFQLLKYFPGDLILVGTVFIPNGVMLVLTLLPVFGFGSMRKFGHFFGVLFMMTLLILVGMLTLFALRDDSPDGVLFGLIRNTSEDAISHAEHHQEEVQKAMALAKRACQLAMEGTPVEGGHLLIRNDPLTTGRTLFQQKCGSCHGFTAGEADSFKREFRVPVKFHDEKGNLVEFNVHIEKAGSAKESREILKAKGILLSDKVKVTPVGDDKEWEIDDLDWKRKFHVVRVRTTLHVSTASLTDGRTASELGDFGTEAWVKSLVKSPMDAKHFGLVTKMGKDDDDKPARVPALTGMRGWRVGFEARREKQDADKKAAFDKELDLVARWVADQRHPRDKRDSSIDFIAAQKAFFNKKTLKCESCHSIETKEEIPGAKGKFQYQIVGGGVEDTPDLTNYASADWIRAMIMRPGHTTRYGAKNQMPAFRNLEGPGSELHRLEFREGNPTTPENMIMHLSDTDRELIIRWMVRDYRPIYGGTGIAK